MTYRKLGLLLGIVVVIAAVVSSAASAGSRPAKVEPQLIGDGQLKALTTTMGGADVLPTTRTVPHWWGSTLDPSNGVTYGSKSSLAALPRLSAEPMALKATCLAAIGIGAASGTW